MTADLIPMFDASLREVGTAVLDDNGQRISVCLSFDALLEPVPPVVVGDTQ